jgi:hypothetical protein
MSLQHLKYEKSFVDDPDDPVWRVVIEEAELVALWPKPWCVSDITHHDTEELADAWLKTHWNVILPLPAGKAVEFVWG